MFVMRMASAALTAAIALNYEGAGTVEFLVDENKNFYFLEMKMEMEITSPGHGVVKEIHANEGKSVIQGAPLVTIVDTA